jgi:nucleotide-binding universal stress UspA family protein
MAESLEDRMLRHVLLVTDGERTADAAVAMTFAIAARHEAEVRVLALLEPRTGAAAPVEWECGEELRARVRMQLEDVGGPATTCEVHLRRGPATTAVAAEARSTDTDLVVIGGRKLTPATLPFRWAIASSVSRSAAVPVLVVAPDGDRLPSRAVAAIDFGASSGRAARAALELLDAPAVLELVQVVPAPWTIGAGIPRRAPRAWELVCRDAAARRLAGLARDLDAPATVAVERVLLEGDEAGELARHTTRAHADLLVTAGPGWAPRTSMGASEHAPSCSVLVVPAARRTQHRAPPLLSGAVPAGRSMIA